MDYKICTKCIMDTTDVDITFDEQGVCNYCYEFEKKERIRKQEKTDLPWIYYKLKEAGKGRKYDCLIGLSGGVDSSLALHYLVENEVKPLTFQIDNGWNSKEADENVMKMVEGLKVPFYRYTIDVERFRKLQVAFIKSGTANIEIPTDHILMASSYEMANKYGIRYIISGGNLATEGIMPKSWGYQARDLRFIKAIYKRFANKKLKGLPMISLLQYLYYRFVKGINVINLLDFYEYNRENAKKLLVEKHDWRDYGDKHCESTFTWWFQNYYLFEKFNIDKRKAHLSSLINSKQITREQAREQLKQPPVYPKLGFEELIWKYPIKSYKDYTNNEQVWNLLSKLYGVVKKRE